MASYTRQLWSRIVAATCLQTLAGGLATGFAGLKPALLHHGVYHGLCSDDLPLDQSCDDQLLALNRIATVGFGGLCISAFFLGYANDKLKNPPLYFLIGIIFSSISLLLFGISLDYISLTSQLFLLPLFYACISISGGIVFLALLYYMQLPPSRSTKESGYTNALIQGAWDLSSGIFWIFAIIYMNGTTGVEISTLFISYGILVLIFGGCYYPLFKLPKELNVSNEPLIIGEPDSSSNEDTMLTIDSTEIYNQHTHHPKEVTFFQLIKTPKVYVMWIAQVMFTASNYWYITTLREQLEYHSTNANEINFFNDFFSLSLPIVGFGTNLLQGYLLGNIKMYQRWLLLSFLGLVWGILSCFSVIQLVYIISIIFPFWRLFENALFYTYAATYFDKKFFGSITFGGFSLGGIGIFCNTLLDWLTINYWNGNYAYVNGVYTIGNVITCSWLTYITFKDETIDT